MTPLAPLSHSPSGPTARAHDALLGVVAAAVPVRDRLERACREHELSFAHYTLLRILDEAPESGCTRSELGDRLLDPAPDVTRLTDTLVRRGLALRTRSQQDRRLVLHRITSAGRDLLGTLNEAVTDVYVAYAQPFSDGELETLTDFCRRIFGADSSFSAASEAG